jgi:amino acid adenylation domain-containing protein
VRSIEELLRQLGALGVRVDPDGDRLRVSAPRGALTPDLRAEMSARKAEIVARLRGGEAGVEIRRSPRGARPPLSFGQARLWFLDRLEGPSTTYSLPNAFVLYGPLDAGALGRALTDVVRRHEVLRTNFAASDGEPFLVIHPDRTPELPVVDLSGEAPEARAESVDRLVREDAARPFDLERSPLLRAMLIREDPRSHVLVINVHHIVFDASSMGCLIAELSAAYRARLEGQPPALPPLPVQYADVAAWQRERLQGERLAEGLGFWKDQLAGAPGRLDLPMARAAGARGFEGAALPLSLPPALVGRLRALGHASGATLFMTVLSAFGALLARYGGQDDVVIGAPVANREAPELHHLIGFFVNTLALRVDLRGAPSFHALLGRVRRAALGAFEHQDVPLEKVVEAVCPDRRPGENPLFQVMLDWQSAPSSSWALPGVSVRRHPRIPVVGRFDLSLTLEEAAGGLVGRWEYDRARFAPDVIARMSGHLETLLEAVAADPDRAVDTLPLLAPAEEAEVRAWDATTADVPPDARAHRLVRARALATPAAVAVESGGRALTYAALADRSQRLARRLGALGVGPDVRVGLFVDRSPDMIVGMLGILEAGGAYVPLDPAYPAARLTWILDDCEAKVVIAPRRLSGRLPPTPAPIVLIDGDDEGSLPAPDAPPVETSPDDLAYVIYTSGSTGAPKGVAVPHRALASFTIVSGRHFAIEPADRVLQFASPSFDAAVEEIFPALSRGATLVLRDDEMLGSPRRFWQACRALRLTVLDLPTAYFHALIAEVEGAGPEIPDTLRLLILGGERAAPDLVRRFLRAVAARAAPLRLVNTYGPTEATVVATLHDVSLADAEQAEVPIGLPIGNVHVHVLDRSGQPAPVGVPGELYIGGAGLARGYLGRADLTEERFVTRPVPPSGAPARLYRTGDFARRRADGAIEFVGRMDQQVKVRGFRVELGEIEAAVLATTGVRGAAITVRTEPGAEGSDGARIVAHVVADPAEVPCAALEASVRSRLPAYMIPSLWVHLRALPLTPNGKVDVRKLPAPSASARAAQGGGEGHEAPRDAVERAVAAVFSELFGGRVIGVHDDFFALGGHSLLALRLVSRIERDTGVALSLASLFQGATVADLARLVRQGGDASSSPLVKLRRGEGAPLVLVHPGGASLIAYGDLLHRLDARLPVYGLEAAGLASGQTPHVRVEDMAIAYIDALRAERLEGPYLLAGFCFGGLVAFEMARRLLEEGHRVAFIGMIDTYVRAPTSVPDERESWEVLRGALFDLFGANLPREPGASLSRAARVPYAYGEMRRKGWIPTDFDVDRLQRSLEVVQGHVEAIARYVPRPCPHPITLIRALEGNAGEDPPTLGWEALAPRVDLQWVPGDHLSTLHEPHVQTLAATLSRCIAHAAPQRGYAPPR